MVPEPAPQVWCPACERTHPPADPAPSTGATAGGEDLDNSPAFYAWWTNLPHPALGWTSQHYGYEAWKERGLRDKAEVAQLRSAKGAWHEAEADAERAREYARECEQGWRQANAELNTLRSDLAHAQAERDREHDKYIDILTLESGTALERDQLRAQLATLQAQKEGWIRSGQQYAETEAIIRRRRGRPRTRPAPDQQQEVRD